MFILFCLIGLIILIFPLVFFFIRFFFNFTFYTFLEFPYVSPSFFFYCFFLIIVNFVFCYKIIKLLFLFNVVSNNKLIFFFTIINSMMQYPVNILNAFILNNFFFKNLYFNFYLYFLNVYKTIILKNNRFYLFFFNKRVCYFICVIFSFFPVILFIFFLFYEIVFLYRLHFVYYIMILFVFSRLFSFFFKQFIEFLYIFLDFLKSFIFYEKEKGLINIDLGHSNCKVFLDQYAPGYLSFNNISYCNIDSGVASQFIDFFSKELLFFLVNTEIFLQFLERLYKFYERFLCISYLLRFCFVIFMVFVVLSINFDYF